ncbi:MAG: tetratricopeptide repeat protein, partial [Cyanobacteria bacterium P01_E01_bin.48]
MNDPRIPPLLDDLKHSNPKVRDRATRQLWEMWFNQKGAAGLDALGRCQSLVEAQQFQAAEQELTQLVESMPDFAEAWNRRAVLYFITDRHQQAIADCRTTLELNPVHFGALNGLGLCHMALSEYSEAIAAFRKALEIQPHSLENKRMLLECTSNL